MRIFLILMIIGLCTPAQSQSMEELSKILGKTKEKKEKKEKKKKTSKESAFKVRYNLKAAEASYFEARKKLVNEINKLEKLGPLNEIDIPEGHTVVGPFIDNMNEQLVMVTGNFSTDARLAIYDLNDFSLVKEIPYANKGISALLLQSISPNGNMACWFNMVEKSVTIMDLNTYEIIDEFTAQSAMNMTLTNTDLIFLEWSMFSTSDALFRIMKRDLSLKETSVIPIDGGNGFFSFASYSSYGVPILAAAGKDYQTINIYEYPSLKLLNSFRTPYRVVGAHLSMNGTNGTLIKFPVKGAAKGSINFQRSYDIVKLPGGDLEVSTQEVLTLDNRSIDATREKMILPSFDDQGNEIGLSFYKVPSFIEDEIRYLQWIKKAEQIKRSILDGTNQSTYAMNSPNGDWIYLGKEGVNGLANGVGDAVRLDGLRYIKDGLFVDGEFLLGTIENIYGMKASGEFRDFKLEGFGRMINENGVIFEGTFVNGILNGQGETIDPAGVSYTGQFVKGKFHGQGKITRPGGEMYEGEFKNGKPHGQGIYIDGNMVEQCTYYEGKRIDQAYLIRMEREKLKQQQLELAKQQQAYAAQQKKKSSNKLFGALLMGVGAGIAGSGAGMDAMQAVEFGGAMYKDVMGGGFSNLESFGSKMDSQFAAQKASFSGTNNQQYTQKAQENNCNLSEIYEGPDGGQGGAYCAQATLMKCNGKMDRVAQLCKLYKQVTSEPCPVCN